MTFVKGRFGKRYKVLGPAADSIMQCLQRTNGEYEHHITRYLQENLHPDAIVFDIGANIGVSALIAADLLESGHVYSFEPGKQAFDFLQENITANRLKEKITPFHLGASDQAQELELVVDSKTLGGSHLRQGDEDQTFLKQNGKKVESISCVKIDDWILPQNIDRLSLIKMDVEGAELDALRGMIQTIKKFKPDLIIEFNCTALNSREHLGASRLLDFIFELFPFVFIVSEHGSFEPMYNPDDVFKRASLGRGIEDILCRFEGSHPKLSLSFFEKAKLNLRKLKRKYFDKEVTVVQPHYNILLPEKLEIKSGETGEIEVIVENLGGLSLSSNYKKPIHLSYHLYHQGEKILHDGLRTKLKQDLQHGARRNIRMSFQAPKEVGDYLIVPSFVQEDHCWLYQQNSSLKKSFPLKVI